MVDEELELWIGSVTRSSWLGVSGESASKKRIEDRAEGA